MANANRRFGFLNFAIFATAAAAAVVLAVGALGYQPDPDGGSVALSLGTATSPPKGIARTTRRPRGSEPLARVPAALDEHGGRRAVTENSKA